MKRSRLLTADGVSLDLLRQLLEHVNLAIPRLALFEPLHDLFGPFTPLAARRALAAAFVAEESR